MGYGWLRSFTNPPPKNKNKARQKLTKATNSALWRANKSTQYHETLSCVGKTPELQVRTVEISGVLAWDHSYPLSYHLELEVLPRWGKLWRQELLSFHRQGSLILEKRQKLSVEVVSWRSLSQGKSRVLAWGCSHRQGKHSWWRLHIRAAETRERPG